VFSLRENEWVEKQFEKGIGVPRLTRTTRATHIRSRSCKEFRREKASTGFARGDSGFATTLLGAKWCCCIVGWGGRIHIKGIPGLKGETWGTRHPAYFLILL
jgi:hypothetical protein